MKDVTIYDNKTLQDLLRDIDSLSGSRRAKIKETIDQLSTFIRTVDDAVVFAPIIKDYLDVWIRSDEPLVKIATLAQRIVSADSNNGASFDNMLTEQEKDQLMDAARKEITAGTVQVDSVLKVLESSVSSSAHA